MEYDLKEYAEYIAKKINKNDGLCSNINVTFSYSAYNWLDWNSSKLSEMVCTVLCEKYGKDYYVTIDINNDYAIDKRYYSMNIEWEDIV